MSGTVVIGVGNEFRSDDGAGRMVARGLARLELPGEVMIHESTGEALSLMELWDGAEKVILVDAAESGENPGAVFRLNTSDTPLPSDYFHCSTHAFSVADAIEMARSLERLPTEVIVYTVEGASFEHGNGLSLAAGKGVADVIRQITNELSVTTIEQHH